MRKTNLDGWHPFSDEGNCAAVGRQAVGWGHVAGVESVAGRQLCLSVTVVRNLRKMQC